MKDRFIELYQKLITRPGADKLLAWLETTDFFEAPASTRFHLSRPGGLVEHSVHVYSMWSMTSSPMDTARSRSISSPAS